jgi:hypothetical protein
MPKKPTKTELESRIAELESKLERAELEARTFKDAASLDFDAIDARYLVELLREARCKTDLFWHKRAIDRLTDVLDGFVP